MTIPQAGGPIGSRAKISIHHPPTKALAKPVSPGSVFAKTPPTGRRPYRNAADTLSEPQAILRATTPCRGAISREPEIQPFNP